MENTHPVRGTAGSDQPRPRKRSSGWQVALKGSLLVLLLVFGAALGAGAFILGRYYKTGNPISILSKAGESYAAMNNPESFFPGQSRVNILCLGLDRNIVKSKDPTINGMPSTP